VWAAGFLDATEYWADDWTPPRDKEIAEAMADALDCLVDLLEDGRAGVPDGERAGVHDGGRAGVPDVPLSVDGSSVTMTLSPFQIVTLRLAPRSVGGM